MGDERAASIVVCTRDRAAALRATLRALAALTIPADFPTELIVVDNGSRDETASVVDGARLGTVPARYVHEARPGVGRARNAGVTAARGHIIAFLDDDVRPQPDWLLRLCAPIVHDTADAVAGGVRLAAELSRPWMEPLHRAWLASTDYIDAGAPREFVSANAAFHRRVLTRVPRFDPELGPGQPYSQGEDALFSWQLGRAGFRLAAALDVMVTHHVDPTRLEPRAFRNVAHGRGRTLAYVRHHWEHHAISQPLKALGFAALAVARHRLRDGGHFPTAQLLAIERFACARQWLSERHRPRNYAPYGLVKRAGVLP